MIHLHPSNVVEELLAWCFHRIRTIVSGAMFGAHGSSSATELLSLYDESVFQEFQLGSFLTTPSVSHETLSTSAILARFMKKYNGRRLKVHWPSTKNLRRRKNKHTFATIRVVVDIFRVGNAEEVSDEQEDFIAHYQQLGQVLDQLTGIVTGVLFVPNGNEEDRESEWRVVRRNKTVSYRMQESAEIAFERLVRVYDDFKERYPHAFQDTSEYEKELNAIKSFTGAAFGALGCDIFHLEMRLRCDLMPNRGLTAPSRKRALSEEPELEEEQQPPVKKMRYSQVAVAVAAAAVPSRKRGLPEDKETGLDEQPQVKKSRSNSSAIPPKKRTQFSPAAPQSILRQAVLRQAGQQRANNRSVKISDTCIAQPFDKTQEPQSVSDYPEEVQDIPVFICRRRRYLRCLQWIPSAPLRKKLVASVLELEACDLSARFDEPDDVMVEKEEEEAAVNLARVEADARPPMEEVVAVEEPIDFNQPDDVVPEKKEEEAAVDLARVEADARPPVEVVAVEEPIDFDQPDVVVEEEEEEEEEVISSPKVHRRRKSREAASLISELGKYWEVPCSSRRGRRVRRQPLGGKS